MGIMISLGLGTATGPSIGGGAAVGEDVHLAPVMLEGTSPMTYRVAWLRDGTPIAGAVAPRYTLTEEDTGCEISLRMVTPDGTALTSENTIRVAAAGLPVPPAPEPVPDPEPEPEPTPERNSYAATLDPAPREKVIHDTRAAWGRNAATIPLSGTTDAPDGTPIMAEIVHAGTGVTVHPRKVVATAEGGLWHGAYQDVARHSDWLVARVGPQNSDTAPAASEKFGAGHVIAYWGQSEIHSVVQRIYQGDLVPEPLAAPEMATFHWHSRSTAELGTAGVNHAVAEAEVRDKAAFAAVANSLHAARPGEKFAIVFQTQPGTGFTDTFSNHWEKRRFSDDMALAAAVGSNPGLIHFSWHASPGGLGTKYGKALYQLVYGRDPYGGEPIAKPLPADAPNNWIRVPIDHSLDEIYDFTPNEGTRLAVGKSMRNIRWDYTIPLDTGIDDLYENSGEPTLLPVEAMRLYRSGQFGADGSWEDGAHPTRGIGAVLMAVGLVQNSVRAMGLTDWAIPQIDNAHWDPAGAYVELWSSAGPIRPFNYEHAHTRVVGVRIDDARVDATIVNGRMRVTAADVGDGAPFTADTLVTFGKDTTGLDYTTPEGESVEDRLWDAYPVVDVGVPWTNAAPVRGNPSAAAIASTIPESDPKHEIHTAAETGTSHWRRISEGGADEFTLHTRLVRTADDNATFLRFGITKMKTGISSDGTIWGNYAGLSLSTRAGVIRTGVLHEIVFTFKQSTRQVAVWVDGVEQFSATGSAPFDAGGGDRLRLYTPVKGQAEFTRLFTKASLDGTPPPADDPSLYKRFEGDTATAREQAAEAPVFDWY